MKSSSGVYWSAVGSDNVVEDSSISNHEHLDAYIMSPSLSKDQLFSIIDFSPNWAYTGLETKLAEREGCTADYVKDQLLEALLREKLVTWLLHKVAEDGKGPSMWDNEGQAPGLLTDPSPEFPSGRTPADLASANGHKGIAGFLAESSLTNHLLALTIDTKESDLPEIASLTGIEDDAERSALEVAEGDMQAGLSLKDTLSAVRNASQAAARIYQVFRVQSFHRKKIVEYGDDKSGISDEHALSLISIKSHKSGQYDTPLHAAAIRIQNKFRGWKGRKEFLIIRQRIVKIQV
ncbi:hypothetical protein B296_00053967 [Ensete ventricosum]|uniref:Uncharacterized protein n=1 Tax=Ensete ventricosum TaxID=4639 RepID=A0A426Y5P4_ENSVE|nr:hypothetical protein B296_00053967 [Ensete ventricosum]